MKLGQSARWAVYALVLAMLCLSFARADDPPRKSNGLTDVVQWDNYTLFLHDQRMFLYSGEFHTFRLPVPELWLDIFQKMVAAGLNGVSIYIHWGLTNPAPGVFDFNDWRALQPLFDAAKLAGIFVVLRPGPYINAETTAGGLALWSTSLVEGAVRINSTSWNVAYQPYVSKIIEASKPNQVTEGGPMLLLQIDNEYSQTPIGNAEYFADLEEQYRSNGIVVPLQYNDPGERMQFTSGLGAPDLYGLDFYPNNFNCTPGAFWNPVPTNFHEYHLETAPERPFYLPEFQGGSNDYWGGPGYERCRERVGPDFADVYYKNNWASNAKMQSVYMFYGGTNWGGITYPGGYTSYDYAGAIKESRALWEKFDEMKRQGIFIRSSPSFRKTDWIGNTNQSDPSSLFKGVSFTGADGDKAFGTYLRNPDTGTGFVVVRQLNGTSIDNISFRLTIPSSRGQLTIPAHAPSISLNGRQSKLIVADYTFGASGSVLYSTASVFFAGTIGLRDVLFVYGDSDQSHEVSILLSGRAGKRASSKRVAYTHSDGVFTTISVSAQAGAKGMVTLWESSTQLVLFADPTTVATFWAPAVRAPTTNTVTGLETFFQFGTNTSVLVGGPYLVRNASLADGGRTLAIRGDLNASVPLTVVAPESVRTVTWNGARVGVQGAGTGVLHGRLSVSSAIKNVKLPNLQGWKFADTLPEIKDGYDDSKWVVADHTSTNITIPPAFGDGRVLYGCDYGFCENIILWRGHFDATGGEKAANLTINGGTAFAASVWLNDVFLKTVSDFSATGETNALFDFPSSAVRPGRDNVLTIVLDHMGNDEGQNQKSDRGIRGFELLGGVGKFSTWKVQGKLGGYTGYPDKVRGLLNEGGLYAERAGWHLPGFPAKAPQFTSRELSSGLPGGRAGVGFFVTTFKLDIPQELDAMISFEFDDGAQKPGVPYRAIFFVNGWHYGKRVGNVGPQARFPVPPGILDYQGTNTLAVALWALEDTPVHPTLQLVLDGAFEGGVGAITKNNPRWTPRLGVY
ncbi:glycoside hydrolase family 35 protein [Trametes coccinea BRFM310]|uniref:beta-galactosidase n=1 Tax=Trametes coccinea (strain BRFM310) TaxID=1353009 RepID=A0A1Y2ICN6_TRAC3|nr:glycoside hydrolase family 35 protein [Trametes coccinea BRFM310]